MKKPRGFSVAETIFAFAVLLFVVLAVFEIFPGAMMATRRAECELHAHSIAEQAIESARALGFGKIPPAPQAIPPQTLDGVTYEGTLESFNAPASNPNYVRGLRARVSWTFRGRPSTIVREVLVSNVKS